ncbi:FGFR1 oncogene partner 2 homolog [Ctenocephalides felis]|uniref:FGFR1 oncogene partner 2 homolog n=1 Tax=Ctenocephalides felis TaxID=7515 RepID=UPI000E6E394B|nr:FGFR1 oncogene partner 2 homolog [Ctenocephalides felis]XP_026467634.1 FGFR1 oncogene partner 2 homolog [Ctenocephalides felis]
MSITIQNIILDAKRLAGRLKTREAAGDSLIKITQSLSKQIDIIKQYPDELELLNEVAPQRPHTALIAGIQQENRYIREIQQENRELRAALEDHQHALEHIMTKYRQHTTYQMRKTKIDFSLVQNEEQEQLIKQQANKIQEMVYIMQKAANIDEEASNQDQEQLCRLTTENKGLRELLKIAKSYGSDGENILSITCNETEDKNIQTDSVNNSTD